jgi:hypothetical protein
LVSAAFLTTSDYTLSASNQQNPANTPANAQWFWGAPIFKRANFLVKTEGGSTLTGETTAAGLPVREDTIAWYTTALLLDEYMEPGQYYSLIVTPRAPPTTYTPAVVQTGASERYFWRLDRTIDMINAESSLAAGKAQINFINFAEQTMINQVNLRRRVVNNVVLTPQIQTSATSSVAAAVAPGFTWNAPPTAQVADAGDYTIDHTASGADACYNKYPTTDFTLNAGDNMDVYLFNSFGCKITNNANNLAINLCLAKSALTTSHAVNTLLDGTVVTPASQPFFAAASTTTSSLVLLVVALFAAIAAAL